MALIRINAAFPRRRPNRDRSSKRLPNIDSHSSTNRPIHALIPPCVWDGINPAASLRPRSPIGGPASHKLAAVAVTATAALTAPPLLLYCPTHPVAEQAVIQLNVADACAQWQAQP
eukprot:365523-Chlamydomonas_euryale.AAC.7